jgi:CRISPR-associated protein Cmr2
MKKPLISYLAVTIGPIFKTMALASRTSESWISSYLFSFLIGSIAKHLKDTDPKGELIVPARILPPEEIKEIHSGIYPDRILFKKSRLDVLIRFEDIVDASLFDLIRKGATLMSKEERRLTETDVLKTFLKKNLLIKHIEWELPEDQNPLAFLYPFLDTQEQQLPYSSEYEYNELKNFLSNIKQYQVFQDVYGINTRFRSVPEIASTELRNVNQKLFDKIFNDAENNASSDVSLPKQLQEVFKKPEAAEALVDSNNIRTPSVYFRFHHKYMAVVQADGDNIGKLIHALFQVGGLSLLQRFSSLLMDFGKVASKRIEEFGGLPIYAGGDDLLFYAPTKNGKGTIFHLIDQIDQIFYEIISSNHDIRYAVQERNNQNLSLTVGSDKLEYPTLSFGVEISFYKHPLEESRAAAYDLLFNRAKHLPTKNALALEFLKHAGHSNRLVLNKEWGSYAQFIGLLDFVNLDEHLLSSVQQKLLLHRGLLERILAGRQSSEGISEYQEKIDSQYPPEERKVNLLNNFQNEFFNDVVHDDEKNRAYIHTVFWLLKLLYDDLSIFCSAPSVVAHDALEQTVTCIRLAQFYTM